MTGEENHDRNIELTKIYQAGVDRKIAYQIAVEKVKVKFENKLVKARVSGCSAAKIAAIYRELENALATDPTLVKFRKLAETMPRPTAQQKLNAHDAANELIATNENLIIFIIRKHFNTYIDSVHFDDMISVGREGMLQSLMFYDPNKGAFSTHVAFFVKHSVYGYLCELHGMSPHNLSQARRYNDAVAKLLEEGNTSPTPSNIAGEMGIGK